jgi:two-component system sensor histidine kinase/response regulator
VKFTERGHVELSAQLSRRVREDCIVQFTVADTGIGIAADRQQVIFSPFVQADTSSTRQYGGTGLGLAICMRLVNMLGGSMWVESQSGQGSAFHFTIQGRIAKRAQVVLAPEIPSVEPVSHSARALNVLLAEDNTVNQLVMSRLLHKRGHRVVIAENGGLAVERARQEPFDVVFMDMQMPEVDGLEATAMLRSDASLQRLPVIALTANASSEDRDRCLRAGMNDYLVKPIDPNELDRVLAKIDRQAPHEWRASA